MRNADILGYISLIIAFIFYANEGYGISLTGLFFNSMACGFFLSSLFEQLKQRNNKKE